MSSSSGSTSPTTLCFANHVQTVVDDLLTDSLALCIERLSEQIAIEQGEVYTLNRYYSDTVHKVMARLDEVEIGDDCETAEITLDSRGNSRFRSFRLTLPQKCPGGFLSS